MIVRKNLKKKIYSALTAGVAALTFGFGNARDGNAQEILSPDYKPIAYEHQMNAEELKQAGYGFNQSLEGLLGGNIHSKRYSKRQKHSDDYLLIKIGKTFAGAITGLLLHEGAHCLAAYAVNADNISYNLSNPFKTSFDLKGKNDVQKAIVYSAGLAAQTLATEIILNSDSISKDNPFVQGFLGFAIGDNLRYSVVPNAVNSDAKSSDIQNLEKLRIGTGAIRGALGLHSAYSSYRLAKQSRDLQDNVDIWINPIDEGMAAGVTYKF